MKYPFYLLLFFSIIGINPSFAQQQDEVFTNYFKRNAEGWNAGDGTISLHLPDGRTLWMFGDSHVDQLVDADNKLPCLFNTKNSIMIQDQENNFTTFYNKAGIDLFDKQFIKTPEFPTRYFWPSNGVVENNTAFLFWSSYENGLDFKGTIIAEVTLPEIELKVVKPLRYPNIEFGKAAIKDEVAGYFYIYGKKTDWIVFKPLLARCRIGDIYGEWEFYSGNSSWSKNPENAVSIFQNSSYYVANEFFVFEHQNNYYLLTQELGYQQCEEGRKIFMFYADSPEGPFENQTIIYEIEDQFDNQFITYNAQAHPQFIDKGTLLISYNVNNPDTKNDTDCLSPCDVMPRFNADRYRPKFVRIPFLNSTAITSKNSQEVALYPNPTSGIIKVKGNEIITPFQSFEVFDVHGKVLKKGMLKDDIDLSELANGLYFIRLKEKETSIILKAIKNKMF